MSDGGNVADSMAGADHKIGDKKSPSKRTVKNVKRMSRMRFKDFTKTKTRVVPTKKQKAQARERKPKYPRKYDDE